MVGIVLVSHSHILASALADLVRQVSATEVPLAISAGIGDDRLEFGTDAIDLMDAIQAVYSAEGVLVLMDLGSAVLSAETALDLLPPEMSEKVCLCPAPFIEGAIAAAVQAGLGSDLKTVCQEARSALLPKIEQIAPQEDLQDQRADAGLGTPAPTGALNQAPTSELRSQATIRNLHGLHARPAARFVKTAGSFSADIRISNFTNGKGPVSAKSLNAVATLGAVQGHEVILTAQGPDAEQALLKLTEMIEGGFGEISTPAVESDVVSAVRLPLAAMELSNIISDVDARPIDMPGEPGTLRAVPISDGVAFGAFYRYQTPVPVITDERIEDPQAEWARLERALGETQRAIQQRRKQLAPSLGEEQAAIFDAHELILQDPDLLEATKQKIFTKKLNGAASWNQSVTQVAESYRTLDDPYLRQRAMDVVDVGNQVLFAFAGKGESVRVDLPEPVILFANELTPTETSLLDMSKVLGLMTVAGGPTSHSAILARALGIPAVSGVSDTIENLSAGTPVGLDGSQGLVWINPNPERQSWLLESRQTWLDDREHLKALSQSLAMTRDGRRVEVVANVGSAMDAKTAAENGAEGIGLLRTEFLFLTRTTPPDENEQYEKLCEIGVALNQAGRHDWPMIVRTLDVGGDKELPYIQLAPEANPFLGVRALRLSLRKPDLFQPQLRAILRASDAYRFRIMFPMVANLDEVLQARQQLEQAHQDLTREGVAHGWPVDFGIMVEIPSAAILSHVLAPAVDFFSIGTNDLTQYTLAAERGNPLLSGMADALHPAVLKLISEVVRASHQHGKWTGVCGELAGDALAVPILVGLGVDELSMNPGSVPRAKAVLRVLDMEQAVQISKRALSAQSAAEARELATTFYYEQIHPEIKTG